jgi:hypothetical protein
LPELTELYLWDELTPAGIASLKKLANVRALHLRSAELTADAVKELQKALPETKIYR